MLLARPMGMTIVTGNDGRYLQVDAHQSISSAIVKKIKFVILTHPTNTIPKVSTLEQYKP